MHHLVDHRLPVTVNLLPVLAVEGFEFVQTGAVVGSPLHLSNDDVFHVVLVQELSRHPEPTTALAVVIDHFGWLGVARSPITASKVLGIALLALGTWFVVRD